MQSFNLYAKFLSWTNGKEGQDSAEYALPVRRAALASVAGIDHAANTATTVFSNIGSSLASLR
jgi:hypothetical protein